MTFSNSSLASQNQTSLISTKPFLIEKSTKNSLGSSIRLVGKNTSLESTTDKSFSPKLINYVEPYEGFSSAIYTTFYTEVNTGLKVGDRVFIINGNYDNDTLIKSNKYKKGRDGYKILLIENCKIVLNIKYTGKLPYTESKNDDFIGLYYVQNSQDFSHVNRQITTRGGNFDYKFNYYQNNIIFADKNYPAMTGWGQNGGLTGSPGFYVRNGTYSWTNITNQFSSGSFSFALSNTYSSTRKVKVYNGNFTASIGVGVVEFKEGFIYKWDMKPEPDAISGTSSIWIADVEYNKPFLTKSNFRDGNFKGTWNTGLFGRQDKKIKWEGGTSIWKSGTLLNTEWQNGQFDSVFTLTQSWFAEIGDSGLPIQKQNRVNNNQRSFSYVIDSEFRKATINNGIFINTNIGLSSTYSVMEYTILNNSLSHDVVVNKAIFENCNFVWSNVKNSELNNCKSLNSYFSKIKSINSDYKLSVIKNSTYISDEIVKILGYDEFIMSVSSNIIGTSHKVYKFYISEKSFHRLKNRDRFYIKGLKLFNNVMYPLNLFDRRFRVGTWTEYIDFYSGDLSALPPNILPESFYKRGIEVGVFLSTPEENAWKFTSSSVVNSTIVVATQSSKRYSVDIVFSVFDKNSQKVEFTDDQNTYDIQNSGLNFNYDQNNSPLTPTMPNFLGNILDVSSAYILESDFESGIIETSDWNNGYHINYNNDVNITQPSNSGGFYNLLLQTSSQTILATTTHDENFVEAGENCLTPGNVVFLNAVDYDTLGKVKDFIIIASGSNYQTSTQVLTTGTYGQNFTVDIVADTIGEILSITYSNPTGGSYVDGQYTSSIISGGSGVGATVEYFVSGNQIVSITVSNGGLGYLAGQELTIDPGTATTDGTFSITSVSYGGILSATISTSGIKYNIGDIVTVTSESFGNNDALLQITAVTGSITRLAEAYTILNNTNGQITLKEITATTSVTSKLLDGGTFYTKDASNRYGYLYKALINRSNIKSGIFRRAFIKNSLIEDLNYDLTNKDFTNQFKIKNLLLSDILFSNTGNILSNATYMNSNFTLGSDLFKSGIVYNSVWNGPTFSKGVFEYGSWLDGYFMSGTFYENRSFNANPGSYSEYYDKNNTWFYVKNGLTTATLSNARISWINGTFSGGEFYKSDWENGRFVNGKFYYSKWYNGNFYDGVIGDSSIQMSDTHFYNGTIWNATVENSKLYAIDTSLYGLSNSTINWYNGIFNSGLFGSDIIQTTASHTASWWNGSFNSGEFVTNAKWKNGRFNGGKFKTKYGWLNSTSTSQSDYAWEDGIFNGGEFGIGGLYYTNYKEFYDNGNPSWYTGEFNGGFFRGRVWNDGLFVSGNFEGSGTLSVISTLGTTAANADLFSYNFRETGLSLPTYNSADGETEFTYTTGNRVWYESTLWECATNSVTTATPSTTYSFVTVDLEQFIVRYHGLWRNGIVTNIKDKFILDQKLYTQPRRSSYANQMQNQANIQNIVWQGGTFNHSNGFLKNSIWWNGIFENGQFQSSAFNPYVRRNSSNREFNLDDENCYWNNGFLNDSDFYISKWNNGTFITGTSYGMIFKGGVSNYMNAFNVFWENGTWMNGNWYGSYFDVVGDGEVTDDYVKQILFRGMSWSGTSSTHAWNILIEQNVSDSSVVNGETASSIIYQPNFDVMDQLNDNFESST